MKIFFLPGITCSTNFTRRREMRCLHKQHRQLTTNMMPRYLCMQGSCPHSFLQSLHGEKGRRVQLPAGPSSWRGRSGAKYCVQRYTRDRTHRSYGTDSLRISSGTHTPKLYQRVATQGSQMKKTNVFEVVLTRSHALRAEPCTFKTHPVTRKKGSGQRKFTLVRLAQTMGGEVVRVVYPRRTNHA